MKSKVDAYMGTAKRTTAGHAYPLSANLLVISHTFSIRFENATKEQAIAQRPRQPILAI